MTPTTSAEPPRVHRSASIPIVLIVEDDEAVREGLRELLESEDFGVVLVSEGREALRLLHAGLEPAVILLDLMMPGMDGWDFRHIQRRDPTLKEIPVVVITATGIPAASGRAQLGDVQMLSKPLEPSVILRAIARARSH
jgi:chemosensory pili system protein ChpA (sensor histidine kinase/response regulator)